jgi:glyoxylase-like metal-dependent hydrolase (beta-lactamase superfamily II)
LEKLRELLPDAKICISKRDNRLLMGDLSLDADEPNTPIRGGVPKNNKVKADILLSDGDRIGSLLAISAPGHTPGLMVYLDTRNNALIVGDAFQARGGIAVAGHLNPLFPFPALATWNKQSAIDSAVRMVNYKPTLLACGHGAMIKNPAEKMKHAIMEAQKKLDSSSERREK